MSIINKILKYQLKIVVEKPVQSHDIEAAEKVLFALFTRYGDTIICLRVMREFITLYPNKSYTVLCPKQMAPYVKQLLPACQIITINKRNPFELIKTILFLKQARFNLGFNPWSYGDESSVFISLANKFTFYKSVNKPAAINHYSVVRQYLQLSDKPWLVEPLKLKRSYKKILICPQSTDIKRSIAGTRLDHLIKELRALYLEADITIAAMDKIFYRAGCFDFTFKKSAQSSTDFLTLMMNSDLVVCGDSAPQHLADSLNIDRIVFFDTTEPEIVINNGSRLLIFMSSDLDKDDFHFSPHMIGDAA